MSNYSEKVCEACQPDADPATKEEINEFLSEDIKNMVSKSGLS